MPLPRSLVRHLAYPLQERLRKRPTLRHVRRFARNDRLSAEELQAEHERCLVEHLRRSRSEVPYYRERVAEEPRGVEDLARFPLLDKPAVREAGRALVREGFEDRVFTLETGGSSGQPLRFFTDHDREGAQLACKVRARLWWGLDTGARETDFWGSPIEAGKQGLARRLQNAALGYQLLSAFAIDEERMRGFRERLAAGRADFVYGYPSIIARYARFAEREGLDLASLGLRLVICTAEVLLPADREAIERAFGCPVANEYGCRDGALIAHECPAQRLHLMHDAVHVEILDDTGRPVPPGEPGEICLTNLLSPGAPLIRYRLGDRARLDPAPCPCGRPHPVLAELQGRQADTLIHEDGRRVHGLALIYVLRELGGVERFRCVQSRRDHLRIEVVPDRDFDPARVQTGIIDRVHRVLGPGMNVEVALVETLTPLPSGKHRYIVNEVPEDPA